MAGPCASTKIAGAYFETVTVTLPDAAWPGSDRTTSGWRPAASAGGTCALICEGEAANSGSGELFNVTQAPPSTIGSGVEGAGALEPKFTPKTEMRPPGAMLAV